VRGTGRERKRVRGTGRERDYKTTYIETDIEKDMHTWRERKRDSERENTHREKENVQTNGYK